MGLSAFAVDRGMVLRKIELDSNIFSLDDVSCSLPQGVYSTFRTYGGAKKVVGLHDHLERLFAPPEKMGITPTVLANDLRTVLKKILKLNGSQEVRIRVSLSLSEAAGQVFVILEDLQEINEDVYRSGVQVVTSATERENPRIKSTTFIQQSAQERKKLLNKDVYEVLMVQDGKVLEGMTSNFYAVEKSKVITAKNGILLGVTRRVVLRLIRKAGYAVDYKPFRIAELDGIDEAFITSSSRGVVPVVKMDGVPVGQGVPGDLSRQLRKFYEDYVLDKAVTI